MTPKEYENRLREIAFTFLAAPAVILIGMSVVGAIIDSLLHSSNTFVYLFSAIGGIPAIGFYYYRKWKRFVDREVSKKEIIVKLDQILDLLKKIEDRAEDLGTGGRSPSKRPGDGQAL